MLRIFVAGGTGVLGRRVIPELIASGFRVTASSRSEQARATLKSLGAEPVAMDLFDAADVKRAVGEQDVVINLATHVPRAPLGQLFPGAWKEMDHLRKEGTALLADAAAAAGLRLFVQESFAPIYPDCADRWITEDVSPQPIRYHFSKTVSYVDETGAPVSVETIKSGLPVTVYYTRDGDQMVATRVIVRKTVTSTAPAPVVVEHNTTTTITKPPVVVEKKVYVDRPVIVEKAAPTPATEIIEKKTTTTTTTTDK